MYVLWTFLILTFVSCSYADRQKTDSIKEENLESIVEAISDREDVSRLVDRKIQGLDAVVPERKGKSCVLFIFNYHDCGSCVNAGFKIIQKIDNMHGTQVAFAVASMVNPSNYQQQNNYYNYVYYDEKDLIRRELKHVPTPVLLLIDHNNTILDAFFPKNNSMVYSDPFAKTCMKELSGIE